MVNLDHSDYAKTKFPHNLGSAMNSPQLTTEHLVQQFRQLSSNHYTGELLVHSGGGVAQLSKVKYTWSLYFLLGRLVWVSSSLHRFRRWRRAIALFCPKVKPDALSHRGQDSPFWEYAVTMALVKRQLLSRERAIAMIEYLAGDVLFDVVREGGTYELLSDKVERIKSLGEPISILNAEQLLRKSHQRWQEWREAELVSFSMHSAPYIDNHAELKLHTSPKLYQTLIKLVDGRASLADIAVAVKQDPLRLTQSLAPYFRKGLIHLRQVPDLPIGTSTLHKKAIAQVKTDAPKILCIDDSPVICRQLEGILSQIGYRCHSIQDSLQAVPTLLEQKPDLIFLDLVMPIASGYEICAQIRRISAFKDTPVIILTGNDGLVDRVRAKVVGASDFMSKPVNPQKVSEVAQRYLPLQGRSHLSRLSTTQLRSSSSNQHLQPGF